MRPDVFVVPVDASVSKIIKTFLARETRRLFVIDQEEMLVGEISIFDLLRAIGEHVDPRRFSRHRP
jgi:CBS domain-containing protein